MRLALIVLYAHFFINGMLGAPAPAQTAGFDVADPRCARVLAPLVVGAQIYDVLNTRNQLARYPAARESDWWTARFAGPQRRNFLGIVVGIALLDYIKFRLTAHSQPLRCMAEANQLQTTLEAIAATHAR